MRWNVFAPCSPGSLPRSAFSVFSNSDLPRKVLKAVKLQLHNNGIKGWRGDRKRMKVTKNIEIIFPKSNVQNNNYYKTDWSDDGATNRNSELFQSSSAGINNLPSQCPPSLETTGVPLSSRNNNKTYTLSLQYIYDIIRFLVSSLDNVSWGCLGFLNVTEVTVWARVIPGTMHNWVRFK